MKKHTRKKKHARGRSRTKGKRRFHLSIARARLIIRKNLRGIQRVLGAISGAPKRRHGKRRKHSKRRR